MENTISSFSGEYRFLSNFYESPFEFGGRTWRTVEHAFQAAKTQNPEEQMQVALCLTPGQAKRLGRQVRLRPDWERVKDKVMLDILRAKFKDGVLRAKLLATGDTKLVEGNTWGDKYWGVCRGHGQNRLGELLMQVRDENQSHGKVSNEQDRPQ